MLVRPAYGAAVLICAFARTLCAEPIAVTPTRFILTAASFIDPSGGLVAGESAHAQFTFEGGRFRAAAESGLKPIRCSGLWTPSRTLPSTPIIFSAPTVRFLRSPGGIAHSAGGLQRQPGQLQMNLTIDLKRAMPYHFSGDVGRVSIAALFRPRIVGGIQRPAHLGRAGNRTTQTFQSSRGADARRGTSSALP